MFKWIKSFFAKPSCQKCNDTGRRKIPVFVIGTMTEYEHIRCSCQPKRK